MKILKEFSNVAIWLMLFLIFLFFLFLTIASIILAIYSFQSDI